MILRILSALIVVVVVALICIFLGLLLTAVGVPTVGAFLTTYAWLIGLVAGLWAFLRGGTPPFLG